MKRMNKLCSIIYKIASNSKGLWINSPLNTQIQIILKLQESPPEFMTEKEEALAHHLDNPLQETRVPKNPQDLAECVLSPVFGTAQVIS